jgi:CelD/BcsL family acetyltransferase involved in cellulose biosynthesis
VARGDSRLTIDSERFEDIEPGWRELFASAGAPPFAHPAWLRAWLDTTTNAGATVFLAVRRGEDLIGVAPLLLDGTEGRAAGDPNVFDYSPILSAPNEVVAVRLGVLEWLREDMTQEFVDWGLDWTPDEALQAGAVDSGWGMAVEDEAVAPRTALPGDFESYLAWLSKKDRHELRRKLRNFQAAGDVSFEVARAGDSFAAALEGLIEMMAKSHEEKGAFLARYGGFFRRSALAMADEGLAVISTLSLEGRPAGRVLTFEHGGVCYLYNSGFDPEFAQIGAGLISKVHVLQDAIARGLHTFDFLRGDEDYKRRLGGIARPIVTATYRQR